MANQEQLDILKQGVDAWNKWREEHPEVEIDLIESDLNHLDLSEINFIGANLTKANLENANLSNANLSKANLSEAWLWETNLNSTNLIQASLVGANLTGANLTDTYLCRTNLKEANFLEAIFTGSDLSEASFVGANFTGTIFNKVKLSNTDLSNATMQHTVLAFNDLSNLIGLEAVRHNGPTSLSMDTIRASKGKISEIFLRGCGLLDWEIEAAKLANPDLTNEEIVEIEYRIHDLRTTRAIKISPLFISYSHADSAFVDTLEKRLNEKGVRFWRDIHDMTAGRIETQIDRAIRQNPTVLLILSKNSMNSDWVQHEVRKARDLEKVLGRDALCPIALDDGWKSSRWPQRVMEQVMEYNILDFSKWEDESAFQTKFTKLLNGLDLFYKKPE